MPDAERAVASPACRAPLDASGRPPRPRRASKGSGKRRSPRAVAPEGRLSGRPVCCTLGRSPAGPRRSRLNLGCAGLPGPRRTLVGWGGPGRPGEPPRRLGGGLPPGLGGGPGAPAAWPGTARAVPGAVRRRDPGHQRSGGASDRQRRRRRGAGQPTWHRRGAWTVSVRTGRRDNKRADGHRIAYARYRRGSRDGPPRRGRWRHERWTVDTRILARAAPAPDDGAPGLASNDLPAGSPLPSPVAGAGCWAGKTRSGSAWLPASPPDSPSASGTQPTSSTILKDFPHYGGQGFRIMEVLPLEGPDRHDRGSGRRARRTGWVCEYVLVRGVWQNCGGYIRPSSVTPSTLAGPGPSGHAAGPPPGAFRLRSRSHWEKSFSRGCQDQANEHGQDPRAPITGSSSPTPAPSGTAGRSKRSASITPKVDPSLIEVDSERAQLLAVGGSHSRPTQCARFSRSPADWQKFKGLPGAEGTLRTAARGPDRREGFAAAVMPRPSRISRSRAATPRPAVPGLATARQRRPRRTRAGRAGRPVRRQARCRQCPPGGKAAKDDACQGQRSPPRYSAAKDGAAKDGAAKDGRGQETARAPRPARAKDGRGQGRRGQGHAAKDDAVKASAAKDDAVKGQRAKDDAVKDGAAKDGAAKDGAAKDVLLRTARPRYQRGQGRPGQGQRGQGQRGQE